MENKIKEIRHFISYLIKSFIKNLYVQNHLTSKLGLIYLLLGIVKYQMANTVLYTTHTQWVVSLRLYTRLV